MNLLLEGERRLALADEPSRPLRRGDMRLHSLVSGISRGTELNPCRGTSAFHRAVEARHWLDERPNEVVKVSLTYDRQNPS